MYGGNLNVLGHPNRWVCGASKCMGVPKHMEASKSIGASECMGASKCMGCPNICGAFEGMGAFKPRRYGGIQMCGGMAMGCDRVG